MKLIKFFFVLSFVLCSTFSHGQIKVNSSGNVGVGGYLASNSYDLRAQKTYSHQMESTFGYVYENAGIGTNYSSSYALKVDGRVHISSSTNAALHVNGNITYSGTISPSSDYRVKKNIKNLNPNTIFRRLSKVRGKKYKFKSKKELIALHNSGVFKFQVDTIYKKKKTVNEYGDTIREFTNEVKRIKIDVPRYKKGLNYGLIAQDVKAQFPSLVTINEATGVYGVDYNGFIPILIEGMNLQQGKISEMSKELKKLKEELEEIKNSAN